MHGLGFELLGSEFSWQCQVTLPSQREAGLKGPLGCQRVASAASDRPSGSRPTRPVQSSGALKHGFGCTLRRQHVLERRALARHGARPRGGLAPLLTKKKELFFASIPRSLLHATPCRGLVHVPRDLWHRCRCAVRGAEGAVGLSSDAPLV